MPAAKDRSQDEATIEWVRAHRDALQWVGAGVGVLALLLLVPGLAMAATAKAPLDRAPVNLNDQASLQRWVEVATRAPRVHFQLLRDPRTGRLWSAGHHPLQAPPDCFPRYVPG